jgi:inosose dehydratase
MHSDRLATTPISWGYVGGNRWGVDLSPERVLGEMADSGFRATEAGVPGFLPDDVGAARALLDRFGLRPIAGPVSFLAHVPQAVDESLTRVRAAADRLAALGADVLMTVPKRGELGPADRLDPVTWRRVLDVLARVEGICNERGLHQAVHPHVGSLVETQDDMEIVLADERIGWCLDTAHVASGGADPVDFVAAAGARIHHFHLKDADLDLGRRMVSHEVPFDDAIKARVFRPLGQGDLDIGAVIDAMARRDDVWWVLEQDQACPEVPAPGDGPLLDALASRNFFEAYQGAPR